ncbi:MAG: hypothetical protein AAGF74_01640 [Pseudomonadota bacterium]
MILVMCAETVRNKMALEVVQIPKKVIGRGFGPRPRVPVTDALFWRAALEHQMPRYAFALLPFLLILWARPDLALFVSQAPIAMFIAIHIVEVRVLSVADPDKRKALIDPARADQILDTLGHRAQRELTRVAAARQMREGQIHLVVEQSELYRVPPFTVVSVQEQGTPNLIVDLTPKERARIAESLFDEAVSEDDLLLVSLSRQTPVHDFPLDVRTISAHARLAAMKTAQAPILDGAAAPA